MIATKKTPLELIDAAARDYMIVCRMLAERLTARNDAMMAVSDKHMTGVKAALGQAQAHRITLLQLVQDNADEFKKPKTRILHGLKVGFKKGTGKVTWAKDATSKVVARIEKLFPKKADVLIKVEKKPIKNALSALPADDLKKLGVTVEDVGDELVCKFQDSDVDKLLKELLEGATPEDEA